MVKKQILHVDIAAMPAVVQLVEEVQRAQTRALLTCGQEVLAELAPAPLARERSDAELFTTRPASQTIRCSA